MSTVVCACTIIQEERGHRVGHRGYSVYHMICIVGIMVTMIISVTMTMLRESTITMANNMALSMIMTVIITIATISGLGITVIVIPTLNAISLGIHGLVDVQCKHLTGEVLCVISMA